MNMGVLLQPRGGSERFSTFRASVTSRAHMICSYMTLQIAGIRKHLVTIFARKSAEFSVYHFVAQEIRPPGKSFRAMLARILATVMTMGFDHMIIQSEISKCNQLISQIKKRFFFKKTRIYVPCTQFHQVFNLLFLKSVICNFTQ